MNVTVRLYGAARVALRCRERALELAEGATVADLVRECVAQLGPRAAEYLVDARGRGYGVAFVVNERAATADTQLSAGDVVALMPPTAGG